jgi:3-hydroxymyristoyl/3-hydroxydecanoyl-(acyl carrier protein) dehydratase
VLHAIAAANPNLNPNPAALDTCEISAVKFLSPARPGDALTIHHAVAANGTIRFEITAGARKIASGSLLPRPPS